MQQSQCKHLGTDANFKTMSNFVEYLQSLDNVNIKTQCDVYDIYQDNNDYIVEYNNGMMYNCDKVIFAVGRSGSKFFTKWCSKYNIPMTNNQVDIGVRVELPSIIWEDFEKKIYEPKILYRSKNMAISHECFVLMVEVKW